MIYRGSFVSLYCRIAPFLHLNLVILQTDSQSPNSTQWGPLSCVVRLQLKRWCIRNQKTRDQWTAELAGRVSQGWIDEKDGGGRTKAENVRRNVLDVSVEWPADGGRMRGFGNCTGRWGLRAGIRVDTFVSR